MRWTAVIATKRIPEIVIAIRTTAHSGTVSKGRIACRR